MHRSQSQRIVRVAMHLTQHFRPFLLLAVFASRLKGSVYRDDPIARSEKGIGTKYLIFPEGSNVQLVYCLNLGTYSMPKRTFLISVTAGVAWELPYENTVPYTKPAEVYHRRSRRELYRKVELMLKTRGKDGRACVLKAICRAADRRREHRGVGTFLDEILHAIFTLPGGWYDVDPMTEYERAYHSAENCDKVRTKCPDIF